MKSKKDNILDYSVTTARCDTDRAVAESIRIEYRRKKAARAYIRAKLGFVGRDLKTCILVTLTTPEGTGVSLNHAWRKFRLRMKRKGVNFEYFAVREWNKKKTCVHLHVIFAGVEFINIPSMRQAWSESVGEKDLWVHLDRIYGGSYGISAYLGKYLAKGVQGVGLSASDGNEGKANEALGGRLYWYSRKWLYNGFSEHSKRIYLLNGRVNIPYLREHGKKELLDSLLKAVLEYPEEYLLPENTDEVLNKYMIKYLKEIKNVVG